MQDDEGVETASSSEGCWTGTQAMPMDAKKDTISWQRFLGLEEFGGRATNSCWCVVLGAWRVGVCRDGNEYRGRCWKRTRSALRRNLGYALRGCCMEGIKVYMPVLDLDLNETRRRDAITATTTQPHLSIAVPRALDAGATGNRRLKQRVTVKLHQMTQRAELEPTASQRPWSYNRCPGGRAEAHCISKRIVELQRMRKQSRAHRILAKAAAAVTVNRQRESGLEGQQVADQQREDQKRVCGLWEERDH